MKHFSEADLLETYYTQPGESMPVMMHLAIAATAPRATSGWSASCAKRPSATPRSRPRSGRASGCRSCAASMRSNAHATSARRTLRVAAAAILSFFLGGAVVYETVKPVQHQPAPIVNVAPVAAQPAPAPSAADIHDAWQSEELKDFHNVVEWEVVGAGQQDDGESGELAVKRLLLAALVLVFATSAFAQNLPPGKWWRRPEIVQSLNLAEEQQNKLENIFRTSSGDLIDLRGEVEKLNINLRGDLDQSQLDRAAIRNDAQRLSDARTRLFERELMMLVDMRARAERLAVGSDAQPARTLRRAAAAASARERYAQEPAVNLFTRRRRDAEKKFFTPRLRVSAVQSSWSQQPEARRIVPKRHQLPLVDRESPGSVTRSRNAPLSTPRTCHAPP